MTMTMGKGVINSGSTKQKVNTRDTACSELVAVDDYNGVMLWSREFIQAQGYDIRVILEQDNESTIKFHKNGKWSSSKRTRHMNIKYFFMKDQIDNQKMEVEHCNTDEMTSDLSLIHI